jgi:DNA invertase Pin-like site-specific DNA recombinase
MEKIAGYIRVSDQKLKTDGERRQDVNRQKEKITKFSESMGWGIPTFYCDNGISAYKEDYNSRPDFLKMIREIRAHRVQRVIIEDLTRWSRRIEDGLKTMKEASEAGCTVTSMSEGNADVTYPEGWFKTAIAFLLAEWASRISSSKVTSGMLKRLDNPKAICKSCSELQGKTIVHLGRHPAVCMCKQCKTRKGRERTLIKYQSKQATVIG